MSSTAPQPATVGSTVPTVEVLLATYNGERYLHKLLESLSGQTSSDFRILARDDGSSDGTVALLRRWAADHRGRLELIEDGVQGCGASGNFARLLAASRAPIVMFCDQDDYWKPRKVAVTVAALRAAEARHGAATPILVHTDLQVVDNELRELGGSFWRYQHLRPELGQRLNRVLVQNVVTGCACAINQPLIQKALPIPEAAIMHDWWLALVAAAFGRVEHVAETTIQYRQHGGNDTGAKRWSAGYVLGKICRFWNSEELQLSLRRTRLQAQAFAERFADQLSPAQRRLVEAYAQLDQRGFCARRICLLRHRLLKIGFIRNLGLLMRV